METIVVTGGTGLVGSAIHDISKDYHFRFVFIGSRDCDLTSYEQTIAFFKKINPSYIIHLAANVGGLFKNMSQKVEMLDINITINRNVLKCAHEIGVKKLVSCMSTCIFPDVTTYPINEDMLHNGPPHTSNYAYAYAKRILEIQSRAYQEQFGDNFICVIPTNIYGPHDNFNLEDAHVIPALIHKCHHSKLGNTSFVVAGSGKPWRQFIFSRDLAKLIMNVLMYYHDKESIILSVNEEDEISIGRVAQIIADKYQYEDRLIFDTTKADGQYKKTADNGKLVRFLAQNNIGFAFTTMEDGIKETIDWFIAHYENCRK
jgi:GDP-L-fucose synthase